MTSLWHPFAAMGAVQSAEFVVDRADGVWIWDEEGRRYLDATAGLWYSNVGHGRREIIGAVTDQLTRLDTYPVFGDFANRPALDLAERLCALAPGAGWKAFLGSGGSDGIDTAIKLSRRYFHALDEPRRHRIVTRESSYHGAHGWGTAIAGIPANQEGFGPPVGESIVVGRSSLEDLEAAFLGAPEEIAAVLAEPVMGAGGLYPPAPGYLQGVQRLCREHGALFIADVVICGFGRLGTWLGTERFELEPDMIVFAKGVTSGYQPLGGVLVSARIAEPFFAGDAQVFRHGATYAGHPAACAAGLTNLDILGREELPGRVPELERRLADALAALGSHPLVAEVRGGVGLLAAVELTPDALAAHPTLTVDAFAAARRRGIIVRPLARSLAVSPPLTVEPEQLDLIAAALRDSLDAVTVAV